MTRRFRTPLCMSLFVFLPLLAVVAHARTLSENRWHGLMQVSDDLEMLTSVPPPPSPEALQKITQYQRPSAPSPPPPESSDSPDQSTRRSAFPCLTGRLCSGFKRTDYGKTSISSTTPPSLTSASASQNDSSLSTAKGTVCNYKVGSMIDYKKESSSPPPPPSSSKSPITVAKPSASPPPPPSSSKSPVTVAKPSASPPPPPSSSKSPVTVAKPSASPPPPPSSSKSPITVAKPSASPPPSPSSSKSPVQISYNPPHIPTIASS
ncbi:vegetative cell wall protein gp1-like [Vitis riparia]|uniref:vegetative cell wall protein gp1-like n=1 Tax=Vitis riparia TaxID=96939 RepID=UPI00155A44B3|nr:vegetative cell wall protein gp1-like [Vitis riparia]